MADKRPIYSIEMLKAEVKTVGTIAPEQEKKPSFQTVKLTLNSPSVKKVLQGIQ